MWIFVIGLVIWLLGFRSITIHCTLYIDLSLMKWLCFGFMC